MPLFGGGGVGAAEAMGVGGAEVGVGGSDSDERKQAPAVAEEDQEGRLLGVFSGFAAMPGGSSQTLRSGYA